jgi:4-hydroxy-3-methylbut-2-enyl diphosphate reductase
MFRFMYGGTGRNRFALAGAAPAKTALLSQTTFSPEEFHAITEAVKKYFPHTEIVDTICRATQERQESLRELCARTDAVLVIGGRGSANTRRLLALAGALGKKAWLVENAGEIPPEIALYQTAGISAGASTPGAVIDAVEAALAAK